jgi:uncharacterized sulfatase
MRPVRLLRGELTAEYPVVQATLTRRYTADAVAFIERNKVRPFFLYLPHAMPHKPLAASEEFYKKSGAGLYGDAIAELDWSVGQILAKLQELGLDERTLVIFTSDNGPWFGGSAGGLRGMKGTSWEGGYRVPFIARWPGKIPAGHVNHSPAVTMDIFATALKATGVAAPADRVIDGRDLMPVLTSDAPSPHDVIFGMAARRIACVRDARWKFHVTKPGPGPVQRTPEKWIDPRGPDGVTILAPYEQYQPTDYPGLQTGVEPRAGMLFDLANDPAEQLDVAAQNPDVVARLSKQVEQIAAELNESATGK